MSKSHTDADRQSATDRIELNDSGDVVELEIEGASDDFSLAIDFYNGTPQLLVERPSSGPVATSPGGKKGGEFYVAHTEPNLKPPQETLALLLSNPTDTDADDN